MSEEEKAFRRLVLLFRTSLYDEEAVPGWECEACHGADVDPDDIQHAPECPARNWTTLALVTEVSTQDCDQWILRESGRDSDHVDFDDPFVVLIQSFLTLFPGKSARLEFCDPSALPRGARGVTHIDEQPPIVRVSVACPVMGALDIMAHELAHVAIGTVEDDDHGPKWEDAYQRLNREWCRRMGVEPREWNDDELEALAAEGPAHPVDEAAVREITELAGKLQEPGHSGVDLVRHAEWAMIMVDELAREVVRLRDRVGQLEDADGLCEGCGDQAGHTCQDCDERWCRECWGSEAHREHCETLGGE